MANIRGWCVIYAQKYIEKKFGTAAYSKLVSAASEAEKKHFYSKTITYMSWCDEQIFFHILENIDKTLGKGNMDICQEVAEFSAQEGLNSFLKFFMRFGDPASLMSKISLVWSQIHSEGSATVNKMTRDSSGNKTIFFTKQAPASSNVAHCRYIRGWVIAGVTLNGVDPAKLHVTETSCKNRTPGLDHCEYLIEW